MQITDLCAELNNWFQTSIVLGDFQIENGRIDLEYMKQGQYFRIVGSTFNDGVYQYPAENLTDEEFDGAIWPMAVPKTVIDLLAEINNWNEKYGSKVDSPYQSESFGGYSFTKAVSSTGDCSWKTQFKSRLNQWRKIRP